MPDTLKPCRFCGNTKIGIVLSRQNGVPSGDDGWFAEIRCVCNVTMRFGALKKSWVEKTITDAWNRRVGHEPAGECAEHNRAERGSWCGEEGEKG